MYSWKNCIEKRSWAVYLVLAICRVSAANNVSATTNRVPTDKVFWGNYVLLFVDVCREANVHSGTIVSDDAHSERGDNNFCQTKDCQQGELKFLRYS